MICYQRFAMKLKKVVKGLTSEDPAFIIRTRLIESYEFAVLVDFYVRN